MKENDVRWQSYQYLQSNDLECDSLDVPSHTSTQDSKVHLLYWLTARHQPASPLVRTGQDWMLIGREETVGLASDLGEVTEMRRGQGEARSHSQPGKKEQDWWQLQHTVWYRTVQYGYNTSILATLDFDRDWLRIRITCMLTCTC